MNLSFPMSVTSEVGFAAVRRAKQFGGSRGWNSAASMMTPVFGPGYVGIKGPKSLMFQEKGTNSFLMKSLEGKTIPMKTPDGLRFIKVKGVGQPGYVTLPNGQKVWRDQKWKHPGITRTDFMAKSIRYGIIDARPVISSFMSTLIGIPGGVGF